MERIDDPEKPSVYLKNESAVGSAPLDPTQTLELRSITHSFSNAADGFHKRTATISFDGDFARAFERFPDDAIARVTITRRRGGADITLDFMPKPDALPVMLSKG